MDTWDERGIQRMSFALTERDPIRISEARHPSLTDSQFDMHYLLELGIVLSGRMRRFYRAWQMDVDRGGAWLCGIWEPHGFSVLEAPCTALVAVIRPELLLRSRMEEAPEMNWLAPFSAAPRDRPQVGARRRAALLELGRRMIRLGQANTPRHRLWRRVLLMEALLLLTEDWTPTGAAGSSSPEAYGAVNPALQLAFASRRFIPETEAARACGMCRNAFNRAFTGLMGMSFARFALRQRLSGAAQELVQAPAPLKALAGQWGFTDASHLLRCFRAHYGCSPRAYRERANA